MTNIAKILKNAPKNLKLYSLVHGVVTLKSVDTKQENYQIEIIDQNNESSDTFTEYGKFYIDLEDGECVLFPSKEHKSWDNWQEILFQVGDVVTSTKDINQKDKTFIITGIGGNFITLNNNKNLSYNNTSLLYRYATPEEREQFMAELNANGYKWNTDTKQMEKIEQQYTPKYKVGDWLYDNDHGVIQITDIIVGNDGLYCFNNECQNLISLTDKFSRLATEQELVDADIKEEPFTIDQFKPFDKVLVRDTKDEEWKCDLFSHADKYKINCVSTTWKQCIPYNDKTKHLLGTIDDCPKKYKTW